jgi:hypothetical protein
MKTFVSLLLFFSSLGIVSGCGPQKDRLIMDYYEEYSFELPFNHSITNTTNVLYFMAEYSIEQICQLINDAGYSASLHKSGNIKSILISATESECTYYFVIYDANYLESVNTDRNDTYTFMNAQSSISYDSNDTHYVFLAPLHILESTIESVNSNMRQVYGSFEYIVNFYRATGKNDFEIDDENQSIYFECEGKPTFSWRRGMVVLKYIEAESGNFLSIEALQ